MAEIWATWREVTYLFGASKGVMEVAVNEPIGSWGREQGVVGPLPTLTLSGNTNFTLAPLEAQTMSYHGGMMRSRSIAQVASDELCTVLWVLWVGGPRSRSWLHA